MKKLEMTYGDKEAYEKNAKLLFKGKHKGIQYAVINHRGMHPCGYIEVTGTKYDECKEYNKLKLNGRKAFWKKNRKKRNAAYSDLSEFVHEGLTYSDGYCFGVYEPKPEEDTTRWFVGWDYAHYGDKIHDSYAYFGGDGKEWTTDEVIEECKRCIDGLVSLSQRH